MKLAGEAGAQIEGPIMGWEFANRQPAGQLPTEIRSWLFREGGS
jgi:hypothetical protein